MKGEDILKALGHIDEKYIEEAEVKFIKRKPHMLRKSLIAAACIVLVVSSLFISLPKESKPAINKVASLNDGLLMDNAKVISLVTFGEEGDVVLTKPTGNELEQESAEEVTIYGLESDIPDIIEYVDEGIVATEEIVSGCEVTFGYLPGKDGDVEIYTAEYIVESEKYMILGRDVDMVKFIDLTAQLIESSADQTGHVIYADDEIMVSNAE